MGVGQIVIKANDLCVTSKKRYFKSNLIISIFILMGLVCIFSYGVDNVSAASPIYVNTHGNDTWNGLNSTYTGGYNGPKATIGNATGTVKSGGTVYIASGTYNENNIAIYNNMTIKGANRINTIINGNNFGSVFIIAGNANVELDNLTIENGKADTGTIFNEGTLIIRNCTFRNNTSTSNTDGGGAILNGGYGTLTITGSSFTSNNATSIEHGGAAIDNNGKLNLTSDVFTNNTANTGLGGAIFNNYEQNGGYMYVTSCIFQDNSAMCGAGIYNLGYSTVTSCIFTDSFSSTTGGAVCNIGTMTLKNSIFTNNSATNSSGDGGGAISNGATLTVTGCTFTSNIAGTSTGPNDPSNGGAISSDGTLEVSNSHFIGNTADTGGAIDTVGSLNAKGNTFTDNKAIDDGGAIYNDGKTTNINFNLIIGNNAKKGNAIYSYYGKVNAVLNWWGCNTRVNVAKQIYTTGNSSINYNPWIILSINANPVTVYVKSTSSVTVDLLHDSNGVYENPTKGVVPYNGSANFKTNKGTIKNVNFVNGKATSTLTNLTTPGIVTISATVNNKTVTTRVIIRSRL